MKNFLSILLCFVAGGFILNTGILDAVPQISGNTDAVEAANSTSMVFSFIIVALPFALGIGLIANSINRKR